MIELILGMVIMILPYILKLIDWGINQGKIKAENKKEFLELIEKYGIKIAGKSQGIDDELTKQHVRLLEKKKS